MRSLAPTSTYRPRAIYLHGPGGPQPAELRARDDAPLFQFIFLSMLLHVLAIMLFGAPSGGSREGRALWGSLQVVLQGPEPLMQPTLKVDRTLGALRSQAKHRDESVPPIRPVAPAPVDLGIARQLESPRTAPPVPDAARVEAATPQEPIFVPQLLDRLVTPEPKYDLAPPLRLPAPTESQVARPPPREAAAPAEIAQPAADSPSAPVPPPIPDVARPAAIDIPAAPSVERIPVEAPPVAVPLPKPAPPPPVAAPLPRPAPPPAVDVPAVPVAPLESIAPRPIDAAPASEMPAVREAPPVEQPAPQTAPSELPRTIERAPAAVAPPARPPAFRDPTAASDALPRSNAPSTFDPTAPALDLDAVRKRASQLGREGSGNRALLPFPMPVPDKPKTKMETAIENARKPDCRTAYQSLGLAAVVPLIANQFGEGNCRW